MRPTDVSLSDSYTAMVAWLQVVDSERKWGSGAGPNPNCFHFNLKGVHSMYTAYIFVMYIQYIIYINISGP